MKLHIKAILIIFCLYSIMQEAISQPVYTTPIRILRIEKNKKQIYFFSEDNNEYYQIEKEELDSIELHLGYEMFVFVEVQDTADRGYTKFIYDGDTMSLKVLFPEYTPYVFIFENIELKKGKYIIDLRSCQSTLSITSFPAYINNVFCDCRKYIRKDEE